MNWISKLRNRKTLAVFLALLAPIAILSSVYSSQTGSAAIDNTGTILVNHTANATSGSPSDIQNAINTVIARGGGTVYIPAGNWTFNPLVGGIGVTLPYTSLPISVTGAGVGVTVLRETVNSGSSVMFSRAWNGESYSGAAVRISGISFVGYVASEATTSNAAISLRCTKDFRIDHCSFQDFANAAIYTDDNTGGTKLVNTGVIDHCTFDNPYKNLWAPYNPNTSTWAVWGYGIIIVGDYLTWDPYITDYLGGYNPTTTYSGFPVPQVVYIENSNFTRCRHAIAANGGAYYVSRYNYFEKSAPYGQCDAHGNSGSSSHVWGTRGMECYSNTFNFSDESHSLGQDAAIEPRGGGGVAWNNTVILNPSYETDTVQFSNDGEPAPYDVREFYVWNNSAIWTNGTAVDFNSKITHTTGVIENTNYFLRAPDIANDGFTYTPYAYPHPLTEIS